MILRLNTKKSRSYKRLECQSCKRCCVQILMIVIYTQQNLWCRRRQGYCTQSTALQGASFSACLCGVVPRMLPLPLNCLCLYYWAQSLLLFQPEKYSLTESRSVITALPGICIMAVFKLKRGVIVYSFSLSVHRKLPLNLASHTKF